jgi:hypothetical protein
MPDTIVDSAQARLLQAMCAQADPAGRHRRNQKSRWEHWDVALPKIDVAIKKTHGGLTQDEALELCRRLWREPVWVRCGTSRSSRGEF